MSQTTTKHNHGPNFGRREDDCPRCVELDNGAPVRRPGWVNSLGKRARDEQATLAAIRSHDCRKSNCGVVCTAFDW